MPGEGDRTANPKQPRAFAITRRDAMLQMLRAGGLAAAAGGTAWWLTDRSTRPQSRRRKPNAIIAFRPAPLSPP